MWSRQTRRMRVVRGAGGTRGIKLLRIRVVMSSKGVTGVRVVGVV